MENDVYPIVQWFNDLDTAQRGGIYQRFIIQPWISKSLDTAVVGTLLLSSWMDVQSISDCYVMLFEHISKKLGMSGMQNMIGRLQIAADRMRVESRGSGKLNEGKRSGEWRPWGFKILVAESESQFSDISLIQGALAEYPLFGGTLEVNGVGMLFVPANIPIKHSHEAILAAMNQVPCVLLNGTGASKLTYVLEALDAIGVNTENVLSVSYSRSCGFKGVRMLLQDNNIIILIRFCSISAAVQLSQWWNGLYLASQITPLTKVTAIYLYDEVSLAEQDLEPQLYQRRVITEYREFMTNVEKEVPSSPMLLSTRNKGAGSFTMGAVSYADAVRPTKRKAESCMDTDDSSEGSTVNESCSSGDEIKSMINVVRNAFQAKPREVLQLLAQESQRMVTVLLQYYTDNIADAARDADELKQIALDYKCTKLRNLVNKAVATVPASSADNMDVVDSDMPVGMIWGDDESDHGDESYFNDEYFPSCGSDYESDSTMDLDDDDYSNDEFISYDYKQFTTTLSNGACGYVSICAILMHISGDLTHIYPAIYINNMHLLGCHLWHIATSQELERFPHLRNKIKVASAVLESPRWEEILRSNQQLWLTVAETTLLMNIFDVPCRSWMWTIDGYKCFNNGVRDNETQCYNLMYHMGHFYVHRNRMAKEIPQSKLCNSPVPSWLRGGSIPWARANRAESEGRFKFWTLLDDHVAQRSTECCRIYPSMANISPSVCYECKNEGCLLEDKIDLGTADPMNRNLLRFYWENHGCNRWLAVERRVYRQMEFFCAVARRFIPAGTVMAPVVGVITTAINSFLAVPCSHVYSELADMNCYIDPTPVTFDTGYYMFLTAEELLDKHRLPINIARYAKVAWPQLEVAPNAIYYNDEGERTIWLVATANVARGEMIWIEPSKLLKLNFHPSLILADPPRMSGGRACCIPERWGNTVVECVLAEGSEGELSEEERMVRYVIACCSNFTTADSEILSRRSAVCGNDSIRDMISRYGGNRSKLYEFSNVHTNVYGSIIMVRDSINRYKCGFENNVKEKSVTEIALLTTTDEGGKYKCLTGKEWTMLQWHEDRRTRVLFGPAYSSDNAGDGPMDDEVAELKLIEQGLEIAEWTAQDDQLLRIACWNSNGHLVANNTEMVVRLVRSLKLDVLMLSDTRLNKRSADWKTKEIKRTLRGYSVISFNTTRSSFSRGGGARMNTMGGTMLVISPRCAAKVVDTGDDKSGLGIAGYVKIIINNLKLCFISMYQPIGGENAGESTVMARLQSHLQKERIDDSPKTYIMNVVSKWISRARVKGFVPIVAGDFNADPLLASGTKLKNWAIENELENVLQKVIKTRYFTHMQKGFPVTCIDHIYTDQILFEDILEGHIVRKPCLTALSDHCVISITIRWPGGTAVTKDDYTELTGIKRIEIPHYDQCKLQEYQEEIEEWFGNNEEVQDVGPADGLALLIGKSVETAKGLMDSKLEIQERIGFRSSIKNGYSPCFIALKSAYTLVLCFHQNLAKAIQQKRLHLVRHNYNAKFRRLSLAWQKQYPVADFVHDELLARAHGNVNDILMSLRLQDTVTIDEVYSKAKEIRNLMHGRMRAEYRKRMSERIAVMEDLRQQKRLGILFKMVNLKEKSQLDLSVLNIEGTAITDPHDIHRHLTKHFAEWYKTPQELHVVAKNFHDGDLWKRAVQGEAFPCVNDESTGFLIKDFFEACKSKATVSQQTLMRERVCTQISLEEYRGEIHCIKFGKAPGPSGLTANMVKAWPESVHEQVLKWLNQIWCSKTVPDWWLKGHLKPIPKSGEISLDNLRPLGLYEITRKILTAIIIKRVMRVWEENGMLNMNQHAFRHGFSTTHAIMRLVNVSEDAAERGVPLWQILWDFRRAFDSIPFNFIRLALVRLAVPEEVVEFLLYLMENNIMTVASPYHMANLLLGLSDDCADEAFHQERGTGQGDPPSPVIWIAIFDVLLDMLDGKNGQGGFIAQGSACACEVYKAHDTAFADDLATISGSHAEQQLKANAVCTFCACTGMQISMAKIRAFAVNCYTSPPGIVLRDSHWEASIIAPSTEKVAMKYLGFFSDHIAGDEYAFQITENYLQNAASHLIHCHAPKETKLLIYRMQIVPKVLYMATKACWNLEQYQKLDKYAARMLKHIGGQMLSSANAMMFFAKDMCGMGIHSISNLAQAQKWGEFVRIMDSNTEAAEAAKGLLERAMRQTVQQAPSTQDRTIIYQNLNFLKGYAGSLVEWGNEVGHCLRNSAKLEHADSNKAILPYLYNERVDDEIVKQMQQKDITVQGELVCHLQNGSMHWGLDETTMLIRRRLASNMIDKPTDEGLVLNGGQMYAIGEIVLEVIGVNTAEDSIVCYIWRWAENSTQIIYRSALYELAVTHVDFHVFEDSSIKRVITVPSECSIPSRGTIRQFQIPDCLKWFIAQIEELQEQSGCVYAIFTDGSCRGKQELPLKHLLLPEAVRRNSNDTSAALVAIADTDNWRDYGCAVLYLTATANGTNGIQSFEAELIALTLSTHVQDKIAVRIHTDCKSAKETVERLCTMGAKRTGLCRIRPIVSSLTEISGFPTIEWVPSHPERRKEEALWEFQDWGIYLADLAASGNLEEIAAITSLTSYSEDITKVATDIIKPGEWYWATGLAGAPNYISEIQEHSYKTVSDYLQRRDVYRGDRNEDVRWSGTSLSIANKCWRMVIHGILGSNIILKNVLDKYWHGRNRAKGVSGAEAEQLLACSLCGLPESQEHIFLECAHKEMELLRQEAIEQLRRTAENEMRVLTDKDTQQQRVIRFFLERACDDEYDFVRLWLGTWNYAMLRDALGIDSNMLFYSVPQIKYDTLKDIEKLIANLAKPLTSAVSKMMFQRCRLERELEKHNESTVQVVSSKRCHKDIVSELPLLMQEQEQIPQPAKKRRTSRRANPRGAKKTCSQQKKKRRNKRKVARLRRINQPKSDECSDVVEAIMVDSISHPQGETESCDYDKD